MIPANFLGKHGPFMDALTSTGGCITAVYPFTLDREKALTVEVECRAAL